MSEKLPDGWKFFQDGKGLSIAGSSDSIGRIQSIINRLHYFEAENKQLKKCLNDYAAYEESISQSLNEGDGVYRP